MIRIIACMISLVAIGPTAASPPPWPGFSEEVIRAGRASHIKTTSAMNSPARNARWLEEYMAPPQPEGIPITREAILEQIRKTDRSALSAEVRALGPSALDVLLEILADDSVSLRDRDEIARHLRRLGAEQRDRRERMHSLPPIEQRPLTEYAGRITDAIVEYHRNNSRAQELSGLVEIVPLDRLPDILVMCEDRREYLEIFSRLTHTDFYERGSLRTDNPTPEERVEHYRQVAQEAHEWWTQHAEDGYKAWAVAGVRRNFTAALQRYQDNPEGDSRWSIHDYKYIPRIGPSTFEVLAKECEQAPTAIKPCLLNQIATTAHPDAAALFAKQLESDDPGILHAAISGLQKMNASQYTEQIRTVLRTTEDNKIVQDALRALSKLGKEEALEEIAQWMNHEDPNIAYRAQSHLRPYFKTHPDELRDIAARHPDPGVRKRLHFLIDQAITQQDIDEISEAVQSRAIVRVLRDFLRSPDPQRRRHGLQLIAQNELAELLPLVVGMLDDREVRDWAASVLGELGIPELSVETAPLFMGHSLSLDRQIAAWCYEKYGREALPLIQQVAFELLEPDPNFAMHFGPPAPFVGFIKVLIDERVEGVAQQSIEMIQSSPHPELLIPVLGFMDDGVSAAFIGDLLTGVSPPSRLKAIHVASVRMLTQHADVLFDIALRESNKAVWSKAERDYEAGKITYEEYTPISLDRTSHPTCSCRAAQALITLGDTRAWDAIEHCLLSEYVEKWQNFSGRRWGMTMTERLLRSVAFGTSISPLAENHRHEMNALLHREISGQKRTHVVLPLTAALVYDPLDEDLQLFREITASSDLNQHARVLAAVARSKLDDSKARPVLREFLRMKLAGRLPVQWLFSTQSQPNVPWPWIGPASLEVYLPQHPDQRTLQLHHVDLAAALDRLGDKTMTDEVFDDLVNERGVFKSGSYAVLRQFLGARAYKKAHDRLSRQNPEMLSWLKSYEMRFDDPQVSRAETIEIVAQRLDNLLYQRERIVTQNLTEIADHLVKLFEEYLEIESAPVYLILDTLAQLGDPRALSLVADDPLLLAEMKHYLPDAPPVVPGRFFKYNRVQDALRLQKWFFEHVDRLHWDAVSRRFRVSQHD